LSLSGSLLEPSPRPTPTVGQLTYGSVSIGSVPEVEMGARWPFGYRDPKTTAERH